MSKKTPFDYWAQGSTIRIYYDERCGLTVRVLPVPAGFFKTPSKISPDDSYDVTTQLEALGVRCAPGTFATYFPSGKKLKIGNTFLIVDEVENLLFLAFFDKAK